MSQQLKTITTDALTFAAFSACGYSSVHYEHVLTFRLERECIFGIFVMIDFIYIDVDYSDKMIVKFTYKSILAE